ncbi:MAG: hypothetical protein WA655_08635 [Candidatus Korobacteraceae bacterium]
MRFLLRAIWMLAMLYGGVLLTAQTQPPAPTHKPAPWSHYCQADGGFCFKYPSSWTMLGEVFAGNGVVVAPAQKQGRALWDEITVALVAPPPEGDEEGLGLDGVIQQATTGMREAGQNFETLQRQQRTVDHKPAEMIKTRYQEKSTGRDWIEELVFIEGPDNEIYSVALKCAPQSVARLEPVLAGVLESWTLPEPEPPADATDDTAPPPASPGTPPATTSPH